MITVCILINGNPIVARNCVNRLKKNKNGETLYVTDSGEEIWHKSSDGAVPLCHKLLDMIKNDKIDKASK